MKRFFILLLIKGIPLTPVKAETKTFEEIMKQIRDEPLHENKKEDDQQDGWVKKITDMKVVFSNQNYTSAWNELESNFRIFAQQDFQKLLANRPK